MKVAMWMASMMLWMTKEPAVAVATMIRTQTRLTLRVWAVVAPGRIWRR